MLPTDVTFGPDGKLYLADWVDGWPKSQKGRIYSITPVNADPAQVKLSAEVAQLLAAGLKNESNQRLMSSLLSHPDRRVRLEAQFELVARGTQGMGAFSKAATGAAGRHCAWRLHAVWGLTQLGVAGHGNNDLLVRLLDDKDPEVRAQAAKGLGDIKYAKAQDALVKKLDDTEPRVQFFAAQSLGKLGSEGGGRAVARAAPSQ